MRILVHDNSGHPFQAQLSRELSRRGHEVIHSFCEAHVSGRGCLEVQPGETLRVEAIGRGEQVEKLRFASRLIKELRYGGQLVGIVRRNRPDVVLVANTPIPTLAVLAMALKVLGTPWALWHQDVYAVAMRSFAGTQLSKAFHLVAGALEVAERWCARRASAIVVIAESFVAVHRSWGTHDKVSVIPNWAPLDELYPVERKNDWAVEHELDDCKTLLYSGTLGLKHNPALLVRLARQLIDDGQPVRLVVVTEGAAVDVLRDEADQLDVPLALLPFQPYDRLPEVLGSGDILVALLEQSAGAFSVPSKTLSYMCAGRPILALMPPENLAASLVAESDGCVLPPHQRSIPAAADWVRNVMTDHDLAVDIGFASRLLAERRFALHRCADQFEGILQDIAG